MHKLTLMFFSRNYDPFQRNEHFIFAVNLFAAPNELMPDASERNEMVLQDRKLITSVCFQGKCADCNGSDVAGCLLSEGIPSPFLLTFFQVYVRLSQCSCFYVGKIYFCVSVLYFIGQWKTCTVE